MRRFRLTFSKGEPVRYISHLDLMRTWERTLRRAAVKLAHSQGFNPRPRLVFAAPLPVGVTSDAEIVDVVVEDDGSAAEFVRRLEPALAPGMAVLAAREVPPEAPSVMASALSADYIVLLESPLQPERLEAFLASASVPYERLRKGIAKPADIRPAVLDLWPEEGGLGVRLRLDVEGQTVRPEEVVRALDPAARVVRVHRTALQLKDEPVERSEALTLPSPAPTGEGPKASHAA
ncbi:MAG TPA: TIGR03936 family radical SAM-associated protein [Chloroflexota bacterium]|nr:TIGR03936 family radical SAM-associated protein [Chloroflexota bacterium]